MGEGALPRSMTGYGAAEGTVAGGRLRVDVRTVNHRFLTLQFKLPEELTAQEGELRDVARRFFERGHVTVSARWAERPLSAGAVTVDVERARALIAALRELKAAFGLEGEVDLDLVAARPEVLAAGDGVTAIPSPEVAAVVERACAEAQQFRAREGAALAAEVTRRLDHLETLATQVERRAPARLLRERDRLREQVATLAAGVAVDQGRLAQEVALLADRLDITEELVRLKTHIGAARQSMERDAPAGRELGFLSQEMLREANTLGAKAGDAEIARDVIAMKGELEKLREQLENLE